VKLPLLISVPHAGLRIPPEVEPYCSLSVDEIIRDGDEQAAAIYDIRQRVEAFLTTDVARAVVDLNRAEGDRRKDGVVKTHTCWDVPVYRSFPPDDVIEELLGKYHRPYHGRLGELAQTGVRLGVDCHTMAAVGPPVGPDPGAERPRVCLSNAEGTCPRPWIESMAAVFEESFGAPASINEPFRGGYIIRRHSTEMPWLQLELSRAAFATPEEKRKSLLAALASWCARAL
jgi:formiminoglutamase